MENLNIRKIKSQKNAAIFLIFGSLIAFFTYFKKEDFQINSENALLMSCCFIILLCASIGLRNSLRKLKNLNS